MIKLGKRKKLTVTEAAQYGIDDKNRRLLNAGIGVQDIDTADYKAFCDGILIVGEQNEL